MNSLKTIGGTVINSEELDNELSPASKLLPRRERAARMNTNTVPLPVPVRRVQSVDNHQYYQHEVELDDIDGPLAPVPSRSIAANYNSRSDDITSSKRSTVAVRSNANLPPATLSRHRSDPVHARTLGDGGGGTLRSSSSPRSSPRVRFRKSYTPTPSTMPDEEKVAATVVLSNERPPIHTSQSSTLLPPPAAADVAKRQNILNTLSTLSTSVEPYCTSSYFQRIFTAGIINVDKYPGELHSVEDALHKCFDVNGDMIRVIAESAAAEKHKIDAAAATSRVGWKKEEEELLFHGSSSPRDVAGHDYATVVQQRGQNRRKPWETTTDIASSSPRQQQRGGSTKKASMTPTRSSLEPTNLSGYMNTNTNVNMNTQKKTASINTNNFNNYSPPAAYELNTPKASNRLPPPTPTTPGKEYVNDEHLSLLTQQQQQRSSSSNVSLLASATPSSTPTTPQDYSINDRRKERAQLRVQQYLLRIDDRVKHVKGQQQQGRSGASGGRPLVAQRAQSSNAALVPNQPPQTNHSLANSFDAGAIMTNIAARTNAVREVWVGMSAVEAEAQMKLFVPTLVSPGWDVHADSVFRANNNSGIDEANAAMRAQQQQAVRGNAIASMNQQINSIHEHPTAHMLVHETAAIGSLAARDKIKALEQSLGVRSLQEYKELLKQKTLELEGLEHKFKTQMEGDSKKLDACDMEIKQFKLAMKEAETAVIALETMIAALEKAVADKNEMIQELERRVETLEKELEQCTESNLQKEVDHQEQLQMLNESILQMSGMVKEKEGVISSFETKTTDLENEVAKTLEQFQASQALLSAKEKSLTKKNKQLSSIQEELTSTKTMLRTQITVYQNEISSSLTNTTQLMELMGQEKDSTISSLQVKISMLEQSLMEVEEEKDTGKVQSGEREHELNGKIANLAMALTEKDGLIGRYQKELQVMEQKRKEEAKKNKKAETVSKKTQTTTPTQTVGVDSPQTKVRKSKTLKMTKKSSDREEKSVHHRTRSTSRSTHEHRHVSRGRHQRPSRSAYQQQPGRMRMPEDLYTEPTPRRHNKAKHDNSSRYYYNEQREQEEARDDDIAYYQDEEGTFYEHENAVLAAATRHPAVYYTTSAEDSIFDFPR